MSKVGLGRADCHSGSLKRTTACDQIREPSVGRGIKKRTGRWRPLGVGLDRLEEVLRLFRTSRERSATLRAGQRSARTSTPQRSDRKRARPNAEERRKPGERTAGRKEEEGAAPSSNITPCYDPREEEERPARGGNTTRKGERRWTVATQNTAKLDA